ncbi:MAG: hypothetical protein KDE53_14300, partial [Caldilineaceae bacterium]|nr:hypothetical protein [Caldilineaceae bacterium]
MESPTTINLAPVDAQLRFTVQRRRVEKFSSGIIHRHSSKPIINTQRQESELLAQRQTDGRSAEPLLLMGRQPPARAERQAAPSYDAQDMSQQSNDNFSFPNWD